MLQYRKLPNLGTYPEIQLIQSEQHQIIERTDDNSNRPHTANNPDYEYKC